jgi:hypothetical protein
MANVMYLSPEQAKRAIYLNWMATLIAKQKGLTLKVPTALVGDTGCGKTDSVRAFAKQLSDAATRNETESHLWTVRMSHVLPEDLGGYAARDDAKGKLVHYMMDALPFDSEAAGVIFLDEFDRAPPENQNAALPLVYGDDFHGHRISDNAYVCIAMNGTADNYTTPLSQAIRTRVCSIFVSRDAADGAGSYDRWAAENGIPNVVRLFHRVSGNLIQSAQEFEELAVCTPRTLDMAGMVYEAKKVIEKQGRVKVDDVYHACIAGLIGMAAATQFMVNEQLAESVDVVKVVTEPDTALLPQTSIIAFAMDAVTGHIKTLPSSQHKQAALNACRYANRLTNKELVKMFIDRIAAAIPTVVATPEFIQYTK